VDGVGEPDPAVSFDDLLKKAGPHGPELLAVADGLDSGDPEAVRKLEALAEGDHSTVAAVALSLRGVLAERQGDSRSALRHYRAAAAKAADGDDSDLGVMAALQASRVAQGLSDEVGRQEALRWAVRFGESADLSLTRARAGYAALELGYDLGDDVERMAAFNKAIELTLDSDIEEAHEVARLAAGALVPLAFRAHRHPVGQAVGRALEDKPNTPDWFPITLKLEEAEYFLAQMEAHRRYARQLFFYVSAFLSSARSVTFHIQSLSGASREESLETSLRASYRQLQRELLDDAIARFFIRYRNVSEKVGYPPVSFVVVAAHSAPDRSETFTAVAAGGPSAATARLIDHVESTLLRLNGPLLPGQSSPHRVLVRWEWKDFPGGATEVIPACMQYLDRLRALVARLRSLPSEPPVSQSDETSAVSDDGQA